MSLAYIRRILIKGFQYTTIEQRITSIFLK